MSRPIYILLADLFDYPGQDYRDKVLRALTAVREVCPAAADRLRRFHDLLPFHDRDEPLKVMQELYPRSFDVQAITTLDLGYVLFGDDYKRGELLVNLSREHKVIANDCGGELGDHLPNVLRLIGISETESREMVEDLVSLIVAPALRQMIREFAPDRFEEKDRLYRRHHRTLIEKSEARAGIYGLALEALYSVLESDFTIVAWAPTGDAPADFLESIKRELAIEEEERQPQGPCEPPSGSALEGTSPVC